MVKKVVVQKRVMDATRRGYSCGIFLALIFLLLTLSGRLFGIFGAPLNLLLDIYGAIGYDVSYFGVLIGTAYGFITGFILSYIHAKIYNKMPDKFE